MTIPSKNSIRARCQIKPTKPRDCPNAAVGVVLTYHAPSICHPIVDYCIVFIFHMSGVSTITLFPYTTLFRSFDTCPLPDKTDKTARLPERCGSGRPHVSTPNTRASDMWLFHRRDFPHVWCIDDHDQRK